MFARPKSLHAKVLMANAYPCHGCAMATQIVPMDLMKLHAVSVDDEKLFIFYFTYLLEIFSARVCVCMVVAMHCEIEFIFKKISRLSYADQTCRSDEFTCANGRCVQVWYMRSRFSCKSFWIRLRFAFISINISSGLLFPPPPSTLHPYGIYSHVGAVMPMTVSYFHMKSNFCMNTF